MRMVTFFATLALAGCSNFSTVREAWNWDATRPPPARDALAPDESARLTNEIAQLQIERNAIRERIGTEASIGGRQELYAQLHAVGLRLSPLERRLQAAAPAR